MNTEDGFRLLLDDLTAIRPNYGKYFLFNLSDAAQVIYAIENSFPWSRRYLQISFYNDPDKDQTVAIKLIRADLEFFGHVKYLDQRVRDAIQAVDMDQDTCDRLYTIALNHFYK